MLRWLSSILLNQIVPAPSPAWVSVLLGLDNVWEILQQNCPLSWVSTEAPPHLLGLSIVWQNFVAILMLSIVWEILQQKHSPIS